MSFMPHDRPRMMTPDELFRKVAQRSVCRHCGESIRHYFGRLWHSDSPVFPQYCRTDTPEFPLTEGQATDGGGWLHEPK